VDEVIVKVFQQLVIRVGGDEVVTTLPQLRILTRLRRELL
jgi:hypothetical protein